MTLSTNISNESFNQTIIRVKISNVIYIIYDYEFFKIIFRVIIVIAEMFLAITLITSNKKLSFVFEFANSNYSSIEKSFII